MAAPYHFIHKEIRHTSAYSIIIYSPLYPVTLHALVQFKLPTPFIKSFNENVCSEKTG